MPSSIPVLLWLPSVFVLALLGAACDTEDPPRKKSTAPSNTHEAATTPPPNTTQAPTPPPKSIEPAPPELPTRSTLEDQLTSIDAFPKAEGPEKITLRWKLDPASKHTLTFLEKTETRMQSPEKPPGMRNELQGRYTIEGNALTLTIDKGSLTPLTNPARPPIELSDAEKKPLTVQGFTERGHIKNPDNRNPLQTFVLPEAELAKGTPLKQSDQHPFNFLGTPTQVQGELTYTLKDFVSVQETPCAWVHISGSYTQLKIPETAAGKDGKIATVVNANICFDFKNGRLLFAETASRQAFWLFDPNETDMPNTYMDADTYVKLTLQP